MAHRVYLFAGWIRLWHWVNLILMIVLAVSGLGLHLAVRQLGGLDFNLAHRLHSLCGIALAVSYLLFAGASLATGNWRQFVPRVQGYGARAVRQARHYLFDIFFGRPAPFPSTAEDHFNPLQKVIYLAVMALLMPLLIISGLLCLQPGLAPDRLLGVDGLGAIAALHYVVAYVLVLFAFSHVYLCTTGSTVKAHFKAMVTGWHEE